MRKKGLKVTKCKRDGKIIEVVLIPKLPDGHFDLDANDIQGAVMEDIVDDGQAAIRDGQVQDKFDSLVKHALAEVNQCLGERRAGGAGTDQRGRGCATADRQGRHRRRERIHG